MFFPTVCPMVLQSVTKERSMKLLTQQTDIANLARQILHVLNFTHSAINSGSSTALLYSKRLVRRTDKHTQKQSQGKART